MIYIFDGRKPVIGEDTYVSETAIVIGDVRVGDKCYLGHGAILRGDYGTIEIGDGTAIEERVVIHAPPENTCRIGRQVTIGHGAIIHSRSIGNSASIGMGAILSLNVEIGERSIVAEGSVVKRGQKIMAGVVIAGNPARTVREVSPKDERFWNWGKQIYIDLAKKYLTIGMHKID